MGCRLWGSIPVLFISVAEKELARRAAEKKEAESKEDKPSSRRSSADSSEESVAPVTRRIVIGKKVSILTVH